MIHSDYFFRGCSFVPKTAQLWPPECLWAGSVGFRKHYRWVPNCQFPIRNCEPQSCHFMNEKSTLYMALQVMGHTAGIMSLTWELSNPCWTLLAQTFLCHSCAMWPGWLWICVETRTPLLPWKLFRRSCQHCVSWFTILTLM